MDVINTVTSEGKRKHFEFYVMYLAILVLFNVYDVLFLFYFKTKIACLSGSFDGSDKYCH